MDPLLFDSDLVVRSAITLKKLKSDLVLVDIYIYMFNVWFGFTEINVDLLRFWWLWRRSKSYVHFIALKP